MITFEEKSVGENRAEYEQMLARKTQALGHHTAADPSSHRF